MKGMKKKLTKTARDPNSRINNHYEMNYIMLFLVFQQTLKWQRNLKAPAVFRMQGKKQ